MERTEKVALIISILLLSMSIVSAIYLKEKEKEILLVEPDASLIYIFSFDQQNQWSMVEFINKCNLENVENYTIVFKSLEETTSYKWNEIKNGTLSINNFSCNGIFFEPVIIKIGNASILLFEPAYNKLLIKKDDYEGISFATIINLSVSQPQKHKYTIVGADGYEKTVDWEDMKKGILSKERKSIFPHLRKAFWVKDVVKIEVI